MGDVGIAAFAELPFMGGLTKLIRFFNQRDIIWFEVGDMFGEFG